MNTRKNTSKVFGERLRNLRKDAGLSLQEIADRLNLEYGAITNKGMISKYENGIHDPSASTIYCLGRILNVSSDYLTGKTDEKNPPEPLNKGEMTGITIPVYSSMTDTEHIVDERFPDEIIPKKMLTGGREFFALKVSGGRLAPKFQNDDIIIFERKRKCSKGAICAVSVAGGEVLLCNVVKKREGKHINPLDPAHESNFYTTEELKNTPVVILGEAIELRRKLKM